MERNKNVDIIRACSILLIIIYHAVRVKEQLPAFLHIRQFVTYAGQIGVALFFILSGYGVVCSLYNKEAAGTPYSYADFMKRRLFRVVPQYWFNIIALLFLTNCAGFIGKDGMIHIVSHMLFVHNFSSGTAVSMNGVLWTMGVTVQFYFIAQPLYKAVKKNPILICILAILVTVLCKVILFTAFQERGLDEWYYRLHGRQLCTALDNFVIGMTVGYCMQSGKFKRIQNNGIRLVFVVISIFLVDALVVFADHRNIHANTTTAWLWYSALAVVLGFLIWNFANMESISFKPFLWIAKYEYGIYLWHLVIIDTMLSYSSWMRSLSERSTYLFVLTIIAISSLVGYISTVGIDEGLMGRLQRKKKK